MWHFGCPHKRMTLPMTLSQRGADGEITRRTYVTCLTCGEELAYNWDKMRTEGRVIPPVIASVGGWQGKAESRPRA